MGMQPVLYECNASCIVFPFIELINLYAIGLWRRWKIIPLEAEFRCNLFKKNNHNTDCLKQLCVLYQVCVRAKKNTFQWMLHMQIALSSRSVIHNPCDVKTIPRGISRSWKSWAVKDVSLLAERINFTQNKQRENNFQSVRVFPLIFLLSFSVSRPSQTLLAPE